VFSLYRDHYEGTQIDLTQGITAGPYGDPSRFIGAYDGGFTNVTIGNIEGAWERAISVNYQGYIYVNQVRPDAPEETKGLIWFGPDVAYTTCFTPFSTKVPLPAAYEIGAPQKFDPNSAWWAFDFVTNLTRLNYLRITSTDVRPRQLEYEREQQVRRTPLTCSANGGNSPTCRWPSTPMVSATRQIRHRPETSDIRPNGWLTRIIWTAR
jgi:dipeptidase